MDCIISWNFPNKHYNLKISTPFVCVCVCDWSWNLLIQLVSETAPESIYVHSRPAVTSLRYHAQPFIWELGIQMQVLTLTQQRLLFPRSHVLSLHWRFRSSCHISLCILACWPLHWEHSPLPHFPCRILLWSSWPESCAVLFRKPPSLACEKEPPSLTVLLPCMSPVLYSVQKLTHDSWLAHTANLIWSHWLQSSIMQMCVQEVSWWPGPPPATKLCLWHSHQPTIDASIKEKLWFSYFPYPLILCLEFSTSKMVCKSKIFLGL
jgi:hypothetical protein